MCLDFLSYAVQRQHRVVEEYFDLLFNEDTVVTGSASVRDRPLPKGHRNSRRPKKGKNSLSSFHSSSDGSSLSTGLSSASADTSSVETDVLSPRQPLRHGRGVQGHMFPPSAEDNSDVPSVCVDEVFPSNCATIQEGEDSDEEIDELNMRSSVAAVAPERSSLNGGDVAAAIAQGSAPSTAAPVENAAMSFSEFLRVNMRLAEDRVLSFVTVFSTGFGTKWIPGATFYYEPEVTFGTLLTQRWDAYICFCGALAGWRAPTCHNCITHDTHC